MNSDDYYLRESLPNDKDLEIYLDDFSVYIIFSKDEVTLKKVSAPLGNAVMETEAFIQNAARNGRNTVLGLLEFIESQPAVALSVDSIGAVTLRGSNSFKDFAKYNKAVNSFGAKAKQSGSFRSIKVMIKEKQLPTKGKIRFVPNENSKRVGRIDFSRLNNQKGFKDKFDNVWVKAKKSKCPLHPEGFEWDVQLSKSGKSMLGWASKSGKHLNVSPKGYITH